MAFQYLVVIFALFVIRKTWRQYRAEQVSFYWLVVGVLLFGSMAIAALVPQATDRFAAYVGIGRGVDLIVYVAVAGLSYATYRLLARQLILSREITALTREIAIMRAEVPPETR